MSDALPHYELVVALRELNRRQELRDKRLRRARALYLRMVCWIAKYAMLF